MAEPKADTKRVGEVFMALSNMEFKTFEELEAFMKENDMKVEMVNDNRYIVYNGREKTCLFIIDT